MTNRKTKDSSSKIIFGDPTLCAQFLRDYTDIPILKNVRPEDIENMTNRYVRMFTEERDSDTVNKVNLRDEYGNEKPIYLVTLIEHKSNVDYNVIMQILRYIVFIWEDYEKEQNKKHNRISYTKDFNYPPVLPIIYYEGSDEWTAALRLHDRIYLSDIFGDYIPDYRCLLMNLHKYTKEDIMDKNDELSLIMLINQLSKASDFAGLSKSIRKDFAKNVTEHSSEYLVNIILQVIEALLVRINVPQDEVDGFVDVVKERNMGKLFDHFEDYDVQAERKKARSEGLTEGRLEAHAESVKKLARYNMSQNPDMTEEQAMELAASILD